MSQQPPYNQEDQDDVVLQPSPLSPDHASAMNTVKEQKTTVSFSFLPPSEMKIVHKNFETMLRIKLKNDVKTWDMVEKWAINKAGWALRLMAHWYKEVEKDYGKACDFYSQDSELGCARSEFMLGHLQIAYIYPRNLHVAVYHFKKAIKMDPNMADAYFVLGCICSEKYDISNYIEFNDVDFWKVAAKLGHAPAQKKLRARGETDASCFPPVQTKHILV